MVHAFLLLFGIFLVVLGVVICVLLFSVGLRGEKGIWLVTIPGIVVVALLAVDFACHILHLPRHVFPYQKQIIDAINWTLLIAALPLSLIKLYGLWAKKRAQAVPPMNV